MRIASVALSSGVLSVLVTVLGGCAARPAIVHGAGEPPAERQIVLVDHGELVALDREVEELASRADCDGACEAGERLCALGVRICEIAGRDPGDSEIMGRCADGRQRCQRARERLAESCACGGRSSIGE